VLLAMFGNFLVMKIVVRIVVEIDSYGRSNNSQPEIVVNVGVFCD
jgi:hypothetical protein